MHTQGQVLDLQQTINGITVTVHWIYADAQQVLVGYTVRSADGRRHAPRNIALVSADGQAFPAQGGFGLVGASDLLGVALPPGQSANLPQFGMIQPKDATASNKVRFTLKTEEWLLPPPKLPTVWDRFRDFFRQQQEPQDAQAVAQPIPIGRTTGPFMFELPLPAQ